MLKISPKDPLHGLKYLIVCLLVSMLGGVVVRIFGHSLIPLLPLGTPIQ
jgi:hypothetical protein